MTVQAMNTDIAQVKKIHRMQRKTLKERVEMVQKSDLVAEIQRHHLRNRVKELSKVMK
ncbi:hypothetical protein [Gallibacterium salpingitidis]|uniref:hypothetical protein n=1 Tax=Gallibacterium salpingitidis TaxID=505341 RepID=UPI0012E7C485|nr:hypothetical protein [Gallibacterium salpingitidis]WKS98895.1 hypothetical protein NYR30_09045 [Gallibacterium salpingitidis]